MGDDARRALIIEPDARVREELMQSLAKLGWSATAVASADEALGHLDQGEAPGIILVGLLTSPRDEWLLQRRLEGLSGTTMLVVSEDNPGEFEVHVDGQLEQPPGNGFSLEVAALYGERHRREQGESREASHG